MSTTYIKDSQIHGRYNHVRGELFDNLGKDMASLFWEQFGWMSCFHDRGSDGELLWHHTDLRMIKDTQVINVEAAVKRDGLWKYIESGIDIETRKLKYSKKGERAFISMGDYHSHVDCVSMGDNMLLIPMDCLVAAQKHCGDNYKGLGDVPSSEGFIMPLHGCYRIRKRCRGGVSQSGEIEDFYRIPYIYTAHYRKSDDGMYTKVKRQKLSYSRLLNILGLENE
jgi:hypothetical protein